MILPKFDALPDCMQNDSVKRYYELLSHKKISLVLKRFFDIFFALILTVILAVPMIFVAIIVKKDSEGPVFFRQERITSYGRVFKIFKFRTMYVNNDKENSQVTSGSDSRITSSGRFLRKYRLDELPQVFNVLSGDMSFVGTRPEVPRYVEKYSPEMYATLLMPAGITSMTSVKYKDEETILEKAQDVEKTYVEQILPQKMKFNLEYLEKFNIFYDMYVAVMTVVKVIF